MKVTFAAVTLPKSGAVAVPVQEGRKLLPTAAKLDKQTGGALTRAMNASRFKGDAREVLEILAPSGLENSRILLYGLGDLKKLTERDLQSLGGSLVGRLNGAGEKTAAVVVETAGRGAKDLSAWAADVGYGGLLATYRFDKYKTKEGPDNKNSLGKLAVLTAEAGRGAQALRASAGGRPGCVPDPGPGVGAGQCALPGRARQPCQGADQAGRQGADPGRSADEDAGHGRAAGRRPGLGARVAAAGHALGRRPQVQEQTARRLRRQGRLLRHRRHLDQAGRRHGRHEVGHGRCRRRHRSDAGTGRPQGQGQRGRHLRPGREHAFRQCAAARRHRRIHVRTDDRGAEHRRRGPADPGGRPVVHAGEVQAPLPSSTWRP